MGKEGERKRGTKEERLGRERDRKGRRRWIAEMGEREGERKRYNGESENKRGKEWEDMTKSKIGGKR